MSVAKFKIDLQWKEYNINLVTVDAWMKANAGSFYCGTQAYSLLEIWFTDQPDQSVIDAVNAYWAGLTDASPEATGYVSQAAIQTTIETLKAGLLSKSWDAMSVAERKLVIGQTPTLTELGLA